MATQFNTSMVGQTGTMVVTWGPTTFYDPTTQRYAVVAHDDQDEFVAKVKEVDNFQKEMRTVRIKPNNAIKQDELKKLGAKAEEMFGKDPKKGIVGLIPIKTQAKTVSLADRAFVFARHSDLEKAKWLDATDPKVEEEYDKLFKRGEGRIKKTTRAGEAEEKKFSKPGEIKLKWQKKLLTDKDGKPIDGRIVDKWIFQTNPDLLKDNRYVNASAEAQFLRYCVSADIGAEFDPKGGVIKCGLSGQAGFNLIDAKMSGEVCLPHKNGIDIFWWVRQALKKGKAEQALRKNAKLYLQMKFILNGFAYAGISVAASVAVPEIDYSDFIAKKDDENKDPSDNKQVTAGAVVKGEGFAGGKIGGSLSAEVGWHDGTKVQPKFDTLGLVKYGASGQAGIGLGGALALRYEDGSFTFEMYLQATFIVGASGKYEVELDIEQAYRLATHLYRSVEYHQIADMTKAEFSKGFKKLADYGLAKAINAKDVAIDTWDAAYEKTAQEAEEAYEAVKKEMAEKREEIEDNLKELYNDARDTTQEKIAELNKQLDEIQAKLEDAKRQALEKKKQFCKNLEDIADSVSDFKNWLQWSNKDDIDRIRESIAANVTRWKPYFQMLMPETAGPLFALIGGGKAVAELDQEYQKAIAAIGNMWESTHEKVHVLDNFAQKLIDTTVQNTTEAVTLGKKTVVGWVKDMQNVLSEIREQ